MYVPRLGYWACQCQLLSVVLLLTVLPSMPVQAEIFKYVDERGRQVFVDSLAKVPPQFADQLEKRQETLLPDPLDAAEQAAARLLVNGQPAGPQAYHLQDQDVIEMAGIKMGFFI